MQALLINGSKKFGNDGTRLNATLQSVAKEELESKGYKVLETIIDKGYKVEEELKKIKDSHLIIYQMPAWWMGEPWIVKKYIDEVYLNGVSILFANDGRSRAGESLKYGSGGLARDKRVMLSVTWNAPKEAFAESNGFFEGVGVEGVNLEPKNVRILLDSKPLAPIKVLFLIFSKQYILKQYHTIKRKENIIEKRKESYVASKEQLIKEHSVLKEQCKKYKLPFIEIQEDYESEMQGVVVV